MDLTNKTGGLPNILFLMTDQHRWDALGCVNPLVKTPNLDRLAARGIRFPQAVCNGPICVPSRYSMMLGLYPSQSGVRHNTQFCPRDADLPLPVLPQCLRDAGYQTAGFGKTHWYLGRAIAGDIPVEPSTRGFETRATQYDRDCGYGDGSGRHFADDDPEAYAALAEETRPFGPGGEDIAGYLGSSSLVPGSRHAEGYLTSQAIHFLDHQRDAGRPFFLYLSLDFPHPGFNVPPGYEDLYRIEDIPDPSSPDWPWQEQGAGHVGPNRQRVEEWRAMSSEQRRQVVLRYYALCSYADAQFGRVIERIEQAGELDKTFVIFCSDHGEMLGERGHRVSKYCLYESSVRVPLIVAGPGIAESAKGRVDERHAELVDVLPTLLAVAGVPVPPELPGGSLLRSPCRLGSFCEYHGGGYAPTEQAPAWMWRRNDWKLILYLPGPAFGATARINETCGELYDLSEDPGELCNRYDDLACAGLREEMTRQLLMHVATCFGRYPRQASRSSLA